MWIALCTTALGTLWVDADRTVLTLSHASQPKLSYLVTSPLQRRATRMPCGC